MSDTDTLHNDDADSVKTANHKRGTHPNSLANLRPPWKPGESGHLAGIGTAPMITPQLRRFADMTLDELAQIDPLKLTGAQAIAYGMIIKAATEKAWGDKTREQVLARLDGNVESGTSAVASATVVNIIRNNVPDLSI